MFFDKLRAVRSQSKEGITHKKLAEELKIDASTLSKKLSGKSPLRCEEAIKIVEIFENEFEIKYLFVQ